MNKHTPTPWAHRNGRIFAADRENLTIANIARAFDGDYSPENGEHIVRCVNSHEALVRALKEARQLLNTMEGHNGLERELANECVSDIEAALAAAGAPQ